MAQRKKIWLTHQLAKIFVWLLLLLLISLLGLVWSSYALYHAKAYHQHLHDKTLQISASDDAVFANAVYWASHHQTDKSLKLYAQAASSLNLTIRKNAYYNMANLYLREANQLLETHGFDAWDQITPLLALSKEGYREALRLDPNWLNAKYNYELALRIAPTIESAVSRQKTEDEDIKDQETLPEGWPAIPGFPRGMP